MKIMASMTRQHDLAHVQIMVIKGDELKRFMFWLEYLQLKRNQAVYQMVLKEFCYIYILDNFFFLLLFMYQ